VDGLTRPALMLLAQGSLTAGNHNGFRRGTTTFAETMMPDIVRQVIELIEARPLASVGVVIVVLLYMQLMFSDPHIR
jgi:hypothetical protein